MRKSLQFIAFSFLTLIILSIAYDYGMIMTYKTLIKDSLDLSTKAAALQLDTNPNKIGQGIFDIDEDKAKAVNKDIFTRNLNKKIYDNIIIDTTVLNVHSETEYISPNTEVFKVTDSTIFSVAKLKYKGVLFSKEIEVQLLSGSTLKNKNDLK